MAVVDESSMANLITGTAVFEDVIFIQVVGRKFRAGCFRF